jgi:fucose 4-O-acetylase-like acetyltransferase
VGETINRPRLEWLDALKGLGIVLVVLGHLPQIGTSPVGAVIYAFHVPLFFALSGATLCGATWHSMGRRVLVLLWVYAAVGILSLPFAVWLHPHASVMGILAGLLYGSPMSLLIGPLWFLPALALAVPLAWFVMGPAAGAVGRWRCELWLAGGAVMLLSAGSAIFALEPARAARGLQLAWGDFTSAGAFGSADVAVLGGGFVVFGALLGRLVEACDTKRAALLAGAAALLAMLVFRSTPRVELAYGAWADPLRHSVVAVAVILFLSALAKLASGRLGVLAWIGRSTLPILVLHVVAYTLLRPVLLGAPLGVAICLALFAGVCLPAWLDQAVLAKTPWLSWVFDPRSCLDRWRSGARPAKHA